MNLFRGAKQQTRSIKTIGGCYPARRVALACYFVDKTEFVIHWEDPEDYDDDAVAVSVTMEELLNGYYEPFRNLLANATADTQNVELGGQTYRTLRINDADITIGVDLRILTAGRMTEIVPVLADANQAPHDILPNTTVGNDGILVQLGARWVIDNMRQQPQFRR